CAVRGSEVRRERQPDDQHDDYLPRALRRRAADVHGRPYRDAVDDQPARREGHRRGRHDRVATGGGERGHRRGLASRRHPHRQAGVSRAGVESHPGGEGRCGMIPAPFEYARAESVDHAIELLTANPDSKVIAGGHSLLPLMRLRLARPAMLVDISRIGDLAYVREDSGEVAIGALTRHHDVANSEVLHELCPIVSYTAGQIGDPQVRHVGTIGGSCAHSDPASDMPTVLVALGATLTVRGPGGASRVVPAADFFKGLFEPAVALTNMGERPVRAIGVEEALAGGADPATAAMRADEGTNPPSDTFGSAE